MAYALEPAFGVRPRQDYADGFSRTVVPADLDVQGRLLPRWGGGRHARPPLLVLGFLLGTKGVQAETWCVGCRQLDPADPRRPVSDVLPRRVRDADQSARGR